MITETIQIDTQDLTTQIYGSQDTNLISTFDINTYFNSSSYIEYFVYDLNKSLIKTEYNFTQYTIQNNGQSAGNNGDISHIILDIEQSLINDGFDQGSYITYYNFFNKQIGSNIEPLYIKEISSDRTELRLDSTVLSSLDIIEQSNNLIQERNNSDYFLDFYINLGDNQIYISNNISLDITDPNKPTILIKLYEPLSSNIELNNTLWVVTSIEESIAYQTTFEDTPIIINNSIPIQGPNFNLDLKDRINNSSFELSYSDLTLSSVSSSKNQLNSLLEEKEIDINIDYTNFENFIHFSSVKNRLENFQYKVGLIESYSSSIAVLNNTNSSSIAISSSTTILENNIDDIITNFDGYDYYLYYNSGSFSWPKTNTTPPFILASTGSIAALNWLGSTNEASPIFGGIIQSASIFDENNKDNLLKSIPTYLREDPDNNQYELFINMVAQHFDNIWIYYKDVTEKYNADNRLESGISKDIVSDAIRDFGIKLYQNNFSNEDLYTAFLGLTPEGGLFPFPNITGSLPTPSGYEYINTLISASNDYIPLDDVNKSLYKRIYHNLPYLLKAKGTIPGLRALITSYGIPDTILRINEYGGKDKINTNDWDYWQNEFNYCFNTEGNNYISSSWGVNSSWGAIDNIPNSLVFRFKPNSIENSNFPTSQSLITLNTPPNDNFKLHLVYTGSGYISGSYSGSIKDPFYQYAHIILIPEPSFPNLSASIYLPFFDGNWWSVMINRTGSNFTLYASNKIYNGGNNGTSLGFISSSSILSDDTGWTSNGNIYIASSSTFNGNTYQPFSGSIQEIRYYKEPLLESSFKDYVMNPYSIEGNSINSSPDELIFRASLGGELYTSSISNHPKITGSWISTSSFASNSIFNFYTQPEFIENEEIFYYDQPVIGIKNPVSDKIRIEDNILPTGSTLSPFRRLIQNSEVSSSYTSYTNLLEVAFSPQNEINDDINSQIGYFNIGEFIGDPSFRTNKSTSYPELDILRNSYFEKYTKNYNLFDYIRLIKFFDNSLFKMIKDFVPARTSLTSGIVIKQHLLERNRIPQTIIQTTNHEISGTLKPQWNGYEMGTIEDFGGGTAGSFEIYNGVNTSPYGVDGGGPNNRFNITQSWHETTPSISGSIISLHNSQDEFYNGEFSGSTILVTTQSLNQVYPLDLHEFNYIPILYSNQLYGNVNISTFTEDQFLNSLTVPNSGEMLILSPKTNKITILNPTGEKSNAYIKMHKLDCNGFDNSIPLGQITNILIKYTTNPLYTSYEVLNINEYPNYYLYQISNQNIDTTGTGIDNYIKNYYVSSSNNSLYNPFLITPINLTNYTDGTLGNSLNYFNSSSGIYTLGDTPNIKLDVTASFAISKMGSTSGNVKMGIFQYRNGIPITSYIVTFNSSLAPLNVIITGSFFPFEDDQILLTQGSYTGPATLILDSYRILVTQSNSPTTAICDPVIFEPYITIPNYYNSDNNPTINNAIESRKSIKYQDIDYSQGALIPINFDLLLNEGATKASVQDSNYTLATHINPRYNGSRTTSQYLNVWSSQDTNTYGKLPNIESTKTFVAYCDTIGGYSPERMNSSGIIIKYLIDQNGDIHTPNISENSLYDTQGTFITDEYITISSQTGDINTTNPLKKIIRGGQRLEPILSNQVGSMPGGSFTSSITLMDNNEIGGVTSDFQASLSPTTYHDINGNDFNEMKFPTIINSGSATPSFLSYNGGIPTQRYKITSGMISEGIDVILNVKLKITNNNTFISTCYAQFKNITTGLLLGNPVGVNGNGSIGAQENSSPLNMTLTLPFGTTVVNDEYSVVITSGHPQVYYEATSTFEITQSPSSTSIINIANLWISASGVIGTNTLYTTSSALINYYDTTNTFQDDIPNSGFNSFQTPWGLQPGDEFRFEGREDRVWMVNKAYKIAATILTPPYLIVELNKPLPPSGSVNYDNFLIRRYVDDASAIIFEGLKQNNITGPYIVKPQYLGPKINAKIDKYISDLTQKGLL